MIRIHRGREPGVLPPLRRTELIRVRPLAILGVLDRSNIGARYDAVRSDLCRVQHYKCCYCERNNLEPAYLPVEHYPPKLGAKAAVGNNMDVYTVLGSLDSSSSADSVFKLFPTAA